jgi:hypothetical protein
MLTWLWQVAVAGINFVFGFLLVVGSYVMVRKICMHKGTVSGLLKRVLPWRSHWDDSPHPVLQAGIPETRAAQRALVPFARLLPPFNLGMSTLGVLKELLQTTPNHINRVQSHGLDGSQG